MPCSPLLRVLLITLCSCLSHHALSVKHFPLSEDYLTLESPHFLVEFERGDEELAHLSFNYAEELYLKLSNTLNWSPKDRIHLLISDEQDQANGYATPIPYNQIVIFPAKPSGLNELSMQGNWLKRLILHELVHIIHLDKADDFPEGLRSVFGRLFLLFPNLFQPAFLKEGLATYLETELTLGNGRGNSAYYDMVLRTEVHHGIKGLGAVQQQTPDWPRNKDYSYGVAFYEYLIEQSGDQTISRYLESFSDNILPFLIDGAMSTATGLGGLATLWPGFETWLVEKYEPQLAFFANHPETPAKRLSGSGYYNAHPIVHKGNIYYRAFDPYLGSYIKRISPSGDTTTLVPVKGDAQPIGVAKGKLWLLQSSFCGHRKVQRDLFAIDLQNQEIERQSHCKGYVEGSIAPGPEGTIQIIAVKEARGRRSLVTYAPDTDSEQTLWQGGLLENIASPHSQPGKGHITLHYKDGGSYWTLAQLDLASGTITKILEEPGVNYLNSRPGLGPNELLLTTDKGDTLEIWQFEQQSQALTQLTRHIGGAINPGIDSENQRLIYQLYGPNGWNIATLPLNKTLAHLTTNSGRLPAVTRHNYSLSKSLPESQSESLSSGEIQDIGNLSAKTSEYSALDSLAPRSWFFGYFSDDVQTTTTIATTGQDIRNYHQWLLNAGYDSENEKALGLLSYTFANHINLSYERYYDYFSANERVVAIESHDNYSLIGFTQVPMDPLTFTVFGGLNVEDRTQDNTLSNTPLFERHIDTLGVGLSLNSAKRGLRSIGPTRGSSLVLTLEHDSVETKIHATPNDEQTEGWVTTLDFHHYIQVYKAQNLALRAYLGHAEDGADVFDLSGSDVRSAFTNNLLHKRDLELRAYPDSAQELLGRKARLFSIDYNFPLLNVHRGIAGWPLGMQALNGSLFYESARANSRFERYDAAGFELQIGLDLGYSLLPLGLTAGAAQPLQDISSNREKDANFYLKVQLAL